MDKVRIDYVEGTLEQLGQKGQWLARIDTLGDELVTLPTNKLCGFGESGRPNPNKRPRSVQELKADCKVGVVQNARNNEVLGWCILANKPD